MDDCDSGAGVSHCPDGAAANKGSVGLHTFDSGLNADQRALLEEYGLRFDWRALSDSAYSDLYEKVGDLIIRKGINERGDGENELGERFHDILGALYDAYPDELLEGVSDS